MTEFSNTDIMVKLTSMETTLTAVKEQAIKTNGRVNDIESWKNALIAVDRYKKENPTQTISAPNATTVFVQPKWFQNERLVGGVVAVLLAISALLGFWAGGMPK